MENCLAIITARGGSKRIPGKNIKPLYTNSRKGDVKHSKANIEKICSIIGYTPKIRFPKGLEIAYKWYENYLISD